VCGGEGEVTVLRADCGRAGEVAIKCIPAELAADTAMTIEAEASASSELPASFLLLKQVLVRGGAQGAVMVSQWGGDSLQALLDSPDYEDDIDKCIDNAGDMLACIGLALQEMAKAGCMHRDIKPGNISVHSSTGSYRLLDTDLSMRTDSPASFFPGYTFAYIDPAMARVMPSGDYAIASFEGQAAATSHASDVWALSLVALLMMLRRVPAELDFENYYTGEDARLDFLDALTDWDNTHCLELTSVSISSKPAADLLRRGLAGDPEQRLTLEQLLQHPFIASRVAKFRKLATQQQAATQRQQQRIADMFAEPLAAAVDAEQLLMPPIPAPADRCASCSSSGNSSDSSSSTSSSGSNNSSIACVADVVAVDTTAQQQLCMSSDGQCDGSDEQPSGCFGGLLKACFAENTSNGSSSKQQCIAIPWHSSSSSSSNNKVQQP
jgi:serine/threonine protein kinase